MGLVMSLEDQVRWDKAYRERGVGSQEPSPFLVAMEKMLPSSGRALDIAGGAGANAVWLARRGLEVTLADISPVGLALAEKNAELERLKLRTLSMDLERDPFPQGPWDLMVCVRFLRRPLFAVIPDELAPRGVLVVVHPTRSNLLRHERPGLHHLLNDGELPGLVPDLEVVSYEEGWTEEGHHEARLVAKRASPWDENIERVSHEEERRGSILDSV
jgi:tellurite methyltransferase